MRVFKITTMNRTKLHYEAYTIQIEALWDSKIYLDDMRE